MTSINVTIPAGRRTYYEIPTFLTINNDNVDEDQQSFAVGPDILDVPENISCFQTAPGYNIPYYGKRGAEYMTMTISSLQIYFNY